ncbi:RNA polymerase sigma-70 factor (ECF subfamily) [Arthrobacter sp. PL16]|uniref:sigma-70 family RNA polymerase sigma factor n=1 Tax=Arthrobacter sp. PL16 TaxID=3071720 RepID=UPI002E0AA047|nr:RNA polymerase sigma-70 factor (ECF subfamily) [Arthrobacter sp. PL16]
MTSGTSAISATPAFGGSQEADNALVVLLARVAQADTAAFAELYRLAAPRVFGLVRRVVADPVMSEEVAQEIFLELWSKAASFDPDQDSAPTWILSIARRKAIDRVRSVMSPVEAAGARARPDSAAGPTTVVQDVLDHHGARQLATPLGGLQPLQREALDLAYFGGLTYDETARRVGTATGTVRSRIREGIMSLRTDRSPA